MPAIPQQGRTAIRDAYSGIVSHVGVTTDNTAFGDADTELDPANVGGTNVLIKASTITNIDGDTFEASINIDGDTEFTGKTIYTIGNLDGVARTDMLTRTVRTLYIGVEAGDTFTVGTRNTISDETA